MQAFLNGLILCAGLIIALGPQNIELLRVGLLQKKNAFFLASIFIFCDIFLILLGTLGIAHLIPSNWTPYFLVFAVIFLFSIALASFRRANKNDSFDSLKGKMETKKSKLLIKGIGLSLFNPMVLIETIVIIGGASIDFLPKDKMFFAIGAIASSFLWFFGIAFSTRKFSHFFNDIKKKKILEISIGCFMSIFALWILIKGFFLHP